MSDSKILKTFDAESDRRRRLAELRERLGREPTSEDIEVERRDEAQRNPLQSVVTPPAVRVKS